MGSQTGMGSHSLTLVNFTLAEAERKHVSTRCGGIERLSGAETDVPIRVRRVKQRHLLCINKETMRI